MIEVSIPGYKDLVLEHLVIDYNGSLACDGHILDGIGQELDVLAHQLTVHIVTADTFGKAKKELARISAIVTVLPATGQAEAKRDYVKKLGSDRTAAIGNGLNDELMLKEAALGIAMIQEEGAAGATVRAADIVCTNIRSALKLLTVRKRLIATLRA